MTTPDPFAPLEPDPGRLDRLRERLAVVAADAGLLDVAWRRVDSPLGDLVVAGTPRGLVKVAFDVQDPDAVLAEVARRVSPRVLRAPARLDDVARQLDDYFAGRRRDVDLPVDLRLTGGFRRRVVQHLPEIPPGATASYGEVARAVGSPRAARAVGTACATNPVPLAMPCHRVIRADGSPGQYAGGVEAKQWLLDHERRVAQA